VYKTYSSDGLLQLVEINVFDVRMCKYADARMCNNRGYKFLQKMSKNGDGGIHMRRLDLKRYWILADKAAG